MNEEIKEIREVEGVEEPDGHPSMTPEQWERFKAFTSGFGDQDENGIDLSLLRSNLEYTPTQRIERMRRALAFQMEMRNARTVAGLPAHSERAASK